MTEKRFQRWQGVLPVWLIFLVGTINIVSAVRPALTDRLAILIRFFPIEIPGYSRLFVLVSGLLFYILAYYLYRRSRLAWALTLGLLVLSSIGHLLKGIDYEEVLVAILAVTVLWRTRASYRQLVSLPSARNALTIFVYSFGALMLYGTVGFLLFDDRYFGHEFSLSQAIHNSFLLYILFSAPAVVPKTLFGRLFLDSAGLISAAFYVYIFAVLFAPVLFRLPERRSVRFRARRLIDQFGRDDLDALKTAQDKHLFFSGHLDACIGFGVARGTIVALGDPIATDRSTGQRLLADLCQSAEHNGWRVAFFQIKDTYREVYKNLGFNIIEIGQDALVDLPSFSLEEPAMKNLRTACSQLRRRGEQVQFVAGPIDRRLWQELAGINREWLAIAGRQERSFSQGRFGMRLNDQWLAIVRNSQGQPTAFVSLLAYPHRGSLAIDLIRRKKDIPNGTMDFLFVSLFEHFRGLGYQTCNLGMVPLAGASKPKHDHWLNGLLAISYERLGWFFNFHGLKKFKAKFNPRWESRYLAYQPTADAVVLGLALLELSRAKPPTKQ